MVMKIANTVLQSGDNLFDFNNWCEWSRNYAVWTKA
jgi:predicted secreted acid phosphatase